MQLIRCDRCGKTGEKEERLLNYNWDTKWRSVIIEDHWVNGSDMSEESRDLDLCRKCESELEDIVHEFLFLKEIS